MRHSPHKSKPEEKRCLLSEPLPAIQHEKELPARPHIDVFPPKPLLFTISPYIFSPVIHRGAVR